MKKKERITELVCIRTEAVPCMERSRYDRQVTTRCSVSSSRFPVRHISATALFGDECEILCRHTPVGYAPES